MQHVYAVTLVLQIALKASALRFCCGLNRCNVAEKYTFHSMLIFDGPSWYLLDLRIICRSITLKLCFKWPATQMPTIATKTVLGIEYVIIIGRRVYARNPV